METSYLSAQAFSGADLLHGPLAMIDSGVPVIAVVSPGRGGAAMSDTARAPRRDRRGRAARRAGRRGAGAIARHRRGTAAGPRDPAAAAAGLAARARPRRSTPTVPAAWPRRPARGETASSTRCPRRRSSGCCSTPSSRVVPAVERRTDAIVAAAELIAARWRAGGRLVFVGAGTSGRIAAAEAAELPGTFGLDRERIRAVVAGGAASTDRDEDDLTSARARPRRTRLHRRRRPGRRRGERVDAVHARASPSSARGRRRGRSPSPTSRARRSPALPTSPSRSPSAPRCCATRPGSPPAPRRRSR